jgi:ATP/ADP translocase
MDPSGGFAIIAFGCIVGVCLLFINFVIVPELTRSRWFRTSIASISLALTSAFIFVGAALGYVSKERDAIPAVENAGLALIVITMTAGGLALCCLIGGLRSRARASKPMHQIKMQ